MDLLNQAQTKQTTSRQDYSLTEIVGILDLIRDGAKVTDISLLTGRSVHSLRYKFFEKTALKGKDKPRSIHQYGSIEELYNAYNQSYSEEDLHDRIVLFKQSLKSGS